MADCFDMLFDYFKMDTWSVREGLELVAGFDPNSVTRDGLHEAKEKWAPDELPCSEHIRLSVTYAQWLNEPPEFLKHILRPMARTRFGPGRPRSNLPLPDSYIPQPEEDV
ncbi:MAG: hypothetical protein ACI8P9_002237 [Parasphingorhabdus sp.]|jgi:hypothetical protein